MVWMSAPAGSGKTTLVASYLDARKLPCIWYQLDAGDADPATFFYYLGLAAKKAAPRHKKPLPLLTPEYLMSVKIFSKRYFEELCARLKTPFVLVFDNYHEVAQESTHHEIFLEGLTALPEGVRVVVISRTEPPQQFASLLAAQRLTILGWGELKLAPEESKGIIRTEGGLTLTPAAIEQLHEKAHGWAAGLILMAKSAQYGKGPAPGDPERRAPEEVFDYFANELFDRAEPQIRDFLLKTAFLPKITIGAASKLTGFREAERVLTQLYHDNYFTEKRYQPEMIYQYHPLFRQFLLDRGREEYEPAAITRLQSAAAEILEGSGQVEAAAELHIAGADWARLSRLALRRAQSLCAQGRAKTLESWLSRVPDAMKVENPRLLFWEGTCRMPYDLRKSRDILEQAYKIFKHRKDIAGIYLAWSGIINTFVYEWSDFTPLDRWIEEMERQLREFPKFPSPEVEAHVTAGMFCALMYRQPHHPELPRWRERVQTLILQSTDDLQKMTLGSHLVLYYTWWSGEQAKAAALIEALRPRGDDSSIGALPGIVWRAIEAACYWMTGENKRCLNSVRTGLETADKTGVHLWDFMLHAQASFGTLTAGDLSSASDHLRAMEFIWGTNRRLDISHYHYHLGWEAMCHAGFLPAKEHFETSIKIAGEAGVPLIHAFACMALAEVLIELGSYEEAHDILKRVRATGARMGSKTIEYQNLWIESYRCLKQGDRKGAIEYLIGHLAVGREDGILNHAGWRASVMAPLYVKALEAGIEVEHVHRLIRTRSLLPEPSSPAPDNWPWPYRISTLGTFSMVKDDKPLSLPAKTPKKPLELLKALIAFGGRDVSEELLTDALWPDASGDAAHSSFTTTLQRLRQLLGNEKVIVVQDGRVSIDQRSVWVDGWAFERLLGEAEKGGGGGGETEKGRRGEGKKKFLSPIHPVTLSPSHGVIERAIALYTGHFLAGEEGKPWTVSYRERLKIKFLRAVGLLGAEHERSGKYAKAVEVYQRGLEVDDLAEEFYRRLMTCYLNMGRRADAVREYERCRRVLKASLGVEPGSETTAIYRKIAG